MSEKLGYYSDAVGKNDTEEIPANRVDERCLRCNEVWQMHNGWKCDSSHNGPMVSFDDAPLEERYLTPSMSLARHGYLRGKYAYLYDQKTGKLLSPAKEEEKVSKTTSSFTGPDLSDWRTWARVPSGYCACNCPREQCPTHKHD